MSHYTVLVQTMIDHDCPSADMIEESINKPLAPFIEQRDDGYEEFFEWEDETEKCKEKWETGTLHDDDGERVAAKEYYESYEEFLKQYYGYEPDKIGYYYNPNAKWDWYVVGGRWAGMFPNGENFAQIKDIKGWIEDEKAAAKERASDFYQRHVVTRLAGEKPIVNESDGWTAGWEKLWNCGLRDQEAEQAVFDAQTDEKPRRELILIKDPPSLEEFKEKYWYEFVQSIMTYAVLDENGEWHEPGEMGWWGMSSDTPESRSAYNSTWFEDHILNKPDDMWCIVVDCHI